jgi:hypothetical protein
VARLDEHGILQFAKLPQLADRLMEVAKANHVRRARQHRGERELDWVERMDDLVCQMWPAQAKYSACVGASVVSSMPTEWIVQGLSKRLRVTSASRVRSTRMASS